MTWANQVRILKEQLKALASIIGGSLINALKPFVKALNTVVSHVIAFAQTVSDALGTIFGWKYEVGGGITSDLEDGSDASDDIADGIGDAADNAKKLKNELMGFDEINKLSDDTTSSGSGSGTGSSGTASADGGNWVETDSMFKAFESEIDSLSKLGTHIRDALIQSMDSIDWDSIYEKAKGFGTGLATFLNGLFSADKKGNTVFGSLGTTIAGALNTLIYSVFSFSEEFKWADFGQALKDGIQKFINTADLATGGYTVGNLVKGIATSVYIMVSDVNTWKGLGTKIASGINGFLKSMGKVDPATGKNGWQITAAMFNSLVDAVKTAIGEAISGITWKDVMKGVKDFLGELNLSTVTVALGSFLLKKGGKTFGAQAFKELIYSKFGFTKSGGSFGLTLLATLTIDTLIQVSTTEGAEEYLESMEKLQNFDFDSMDSSDYWNVLKETIMSLAGLGGGFEKAAESTIIGNMERDMPHAKNYSTRALYERAAASWENKYKDSFEPGSRYYDFFEGILEIMELEADYVFGKETSYTVTGEINFNKKKTQTNANNTVSYVNKKGKTKPVTTKVTNNADEDAELIYTNTSSKIKKKDQVKLTAGNNSSKDASNILTNTSNSLAKLPGLKTTVVNTTSAKSLHDPLSGYFMRNNLMIGTKNTTSGSELRSPLATYMKDHPLNTKVNDTTKGSTFRSPLATYMKGHPLKTTVVNITKASTLWGGLTKDWGSPALGVGVQTTSASAVLSNFETDWNQSRKVLALEGRLNVTSFVTKGGWLLQQKAGGGLFKNGSWKPITAFAGGGLPGMGQMFVAREAGPELVGTIGGHTAVMNNDQIVSSVAAGVASAVAGVMSQFSGNSSQELHVYVGGKEITDYVIKDVNQRTIATGACPIMT